MCLGFKLLPTLNLPILFLGQFNTFLDSSYLNYVKIVVSVKAYYIKFDLADKLDAIVI